MVDSIAKAVAHFMGSDYSDDEDGKEEGGFEGDGDGSAPATRRWPRDEEEGGSLSREDREDDEDEDGGGVIAAARFRSTEVLPKRVARNMWFEWLTGCSEAQLRVLPQVMLTKIFALRERDTVIVTNRDRAEDYVAGRMVAVPQGPALDKLPPGPLKSRKPAAFCVWTKADDSDASRQCTDIPSLQARMEWKGAMFQIPSRTDALPFCTNDPGSVDSENITRAAFALDPADQASVATGAATIARMYAERAKQPLQVQAPSPSTPPAPAPAPAVAAAHPKQQTAQPKPSQSQQSSPPKVTPSQALPPPPPPLAQPQQQQQQQPRSRPDMLDATLLRPYFPMNDGVICLSGDEPAFPVPGSIERSTMLREVNAIAQLNCQVAFASAAGQGGALPLAPRDQEVDLVFGAHVPLSGSLVGDRNREALMRDAPGCKAEFVLEASYSAAYIAAIMARKTTLFLKLLGDEPISALNAIGAAHCKLTTLSSCTVDRVILLLDDPAKAPPELDGWLATLAAAGVHSSKVLAVQGRYYKASDLLPPS